MAKSKRGPSNNHFKLVNPILIVLTALVVGLLVVIYVEPRYITSEHFGPIAKYATLVGTEYRDLLKLGLLSLLALHILESMVVVYKCYKMKLKTVTIIAWTVQTLLLGIFSLQLLLWPQRAAPQKAAPQKAAPQKAAPQKSGSQKSGSQKSASQKSSPQKATASPKQPKQTPKAKKQK